MSGDVPFNSTPLRFQWFIRFPFPFPLPSSATFYSHSLPISSVISIAFSCQCHTSISSHLLLLFIDITKEITNKLKTNRSIFVSKTTENQIKHTVTQMSKMSHFSPIQVFLLIVYVGVLACTRREMGNVVFSFPPFPPKFSYTFFIPTELE